MVLTSEQLEGAERVQETCSLERIWKGKGASEIQKISGKGSKMKNEKDVIASIGKSNSITEILSIHLGHFGKQEDIKMVQVSFEDSHPVVVRSVQYVEQLASLNGLPLPSLISAIIRFGNHRLWSLPSVEDWNDFLFKFEPERIVASEGSHFAGLESARGATVSLEFHNWVFESCLDLGWRLDLADPRMITVLALITGLVGCAEISMRDQEEILGIIREFCYSIDRELREMKEMYRLDEDELFQMIDELYITCLKRSDSAYCNNEVLSPVLH
jgi:hypothetical protein